MAKLFVALEEIEDSIIIEPDVSEKESLQAQVELHEAENNLEESGELVEAERIADAVNDADTQIEALEKLRTTLKSFKETGLNPQAAQVLAITTESIGVSLGDKNFITLPSLESFESANSRITATEIALETLSERVSAGLTSMWNGLKEVGKKLLTFFDNIIATFLPVTAKSIEKVEVRLKEVGTTTVTETFHNSSLVKAFADVGATKLDGSTIKDKLDSYSKYIKDNLDKELSILSNFDIKKDATEEDFKSTVSKINKSIEMLYKSNFHMYGGDIFVEGDEITVGNEKVKSVKVKSSWDESGSPDKVPVSVGSKTELMNVLTVIKSAVDRQTVFKDMKKQMDNLVKDADKNIATMTKNKELTESAIDSYRAAGKFYNVITTVSRIVITNYTKSLRAAISYLDMSCTEHKRVEKKSKGEE